MFGKCIIYGSCSLINIFKNMNLKTKTLLFLFISLIYFVSQNNVALAGFGVSPSSFLNKNLVPGSFYEQDIYLVQRSPDTALNAVVTIDAGKINNWIKIENGNSFVIPKGVQQFSMKVDVAVPSNADLGDYKGSITINTSPVGVKKSGVSVTLGAEVSVDLTVTSVKFSSFLVQNFSIPAVTKGSPIKFIMKVKNDGNTDNGPTKVGLTFFDQYHSKQLGQQEENITEKVGSFQAKNISVDFLNDLDIGTYWADVKIYGGNNVIVSGKVIFNVASSVIAKQPQKTLAFPISSFNFSAIPLWLYSLVVAGVVIIILLVIIVVILRRGGKGVSK